MTWGHKSFHRLHGYGLPRCSAQEESSVNMQEEHRREISFAAVLLSEWIPLTDTLSAIKGFPECTDMNF